MREPGSTQNPQSNALETEKTFGFMLVVRLKLSPRCILPVAISGTAGPTRTNAHTHTCGVINCLCVFLCTVHIHVPCTCKTPITMLSSTTVLMPCNWPLRPIWPLPCACIMPMPQMIMMMGYWAQLKRPTIAFRHILRSMAEKSLVNYMDDIGNKFLKSRIRWDQIEK